MSARLGVPVIMCTNQTNPPLEVRPCVFSVTGPVCMTRPPLRHVPEDEQETRVLTCSLVSATNRHSAVSRNTPLVSTV